jgi:hypothetical protein
MKQLTTNHKRLPATRQEIIEAGVKHLKAGTRTAFDIGKDLGLSLSQIHFCCHYTSLSRDFFGNGIQSAAKAYEIDLDTPEDRKRASDKASANLRSDGVKLLINMLLSMEGFSDEGVDKELLWVVQQSVDLKAKVLAIKEYNALKARIKNVQEVHHTHTLDLTALSESELKSFIALGEKALINNEERPTIKIDNQ